MACKIKETSLSFAENFQLIFYYGNFLYIDNNPVMFSMSILHTMSFTSLVYKMRYKRIYIQMCEAGRAFELSFSNAQ